ncbi:hypothetical protein [Isoptericola sp. NPDC056605]|uniref:hypothetical protein n=1 Tax=Isoptericola sp. NPDC056605 TaxID=3345876 RepID=UPI0036A3D12C
MKLPGPRHDAAHAAIEARIDQYGAAMRDALLAALGLTPADDPRDDIAVPSRILDSHGDGRLTVHRVIRTVVLEVIQRDEHGDALVNADRTGIVTRRRHVRLTTDQARTYRERTTLDTALATIQQEDA